MTPKLQTKQLQARNYGVGWGHLLPNSCIAPRPLSYTYTSHEALMYQWVPLLDAV